MTTSLSPLNIATLVPLLALISTAVGILIADLGRAPWRFSAWLSLTGMVMTPALTLIVVLSGQNSAVQGMLDIDDRAALGTMFFCGAGAVTVLLELGSVSRETGSRYALMTFAVSGAVIVVQSAHVLPLVIGLAILSTALIPLLGTREGWQYFALQGAALASTLLGLALLYGATGSLRTGMLIERLSRQTIPPPNALAVLGLALLVGGLGLPLGIVPFHMWFARASHTTRASGMLVASLLLPGAAAIILGRLAATWPAQARLLLITLGALSVLYGYTKALRSHHVRGTLAGAAISQSGYLVIGAALQPGADWTSLFYALANQGLSLTCLSMVTISARRESNARPLALDDLAGMGNRRPWLAAVATLCMLNLAGLPPLVGATSQLLLLQIAFTQGYVLQVALAVGGGLLAWLSAGRWAHTLWMSAPQERAWLPLSPEVVVGTLAMASSMLLAGLYAQGILDWFVRLGGGP